MKKKIEPICKNCLLYNSEKKECKVAILASGKEYHMPVELNDRCHMDELGIPVNQVRWWVEDKEGKKIVPLVKDYDDMSKDTTIDFTITLQKGKVEELEATQLEHGCNALEKLFKLYTTSSTTNMHLFDAEDKLKKYDSVEEIIDDYFVRRLNLYVERKAFMIDALEKELVVLSNKARYIQELLDGTIDLRKKKKTEIVEMLQEK
jgi:DNA topoisomerase-2